MEKGNLGFVAKSQRSDEFMGYSERVSYFYFLWVFPTRCSFLDWTELYPAVFCTE
jgi:hypothetical protein